MNKISTFFKKLSSSKLPLTEKSPTNPEIATPNQDTATSNQEREPTIQGRALAVKQNAPANQEGVLANLRPYNVFDPAFSSNNYCSKDKPLQPVINYPATKNRRFQSDWFKEFTWLEYSICKDSAYCFPCRNFGLERGYADKCFVRNGFNDWKHAKDQFKKHQNSDTHSSCSKMLSNRILKDILGDSVVAQLVANHSEEVKLNRLNLGNFSQFSQRNFLN